ncbi:T6SS Phospholipase effector Tle1-like catalytic domain-containing protein [Plasmodiophora brassicae]
MTPSAVDEYLSDFTSRSPRNVNQILRGEAPKRIALFLDGTWNEPGSNTNIWRIHSMVDKKGLDGIRQQTFYEKGVGTTFVDKHLGGLFAVSIASYIISAYEWMVANYNDGDEVFIFGFSRGAFICRTLMGIIDQYGLLDVGAPIKVSQLYDRYCQGASEVDRPANLDEILSDLPAFDMENFFLEYTLARHSRKIKFKYVGLFDTVCALGIPILREIQGDSQNLLDLKRIGLSPLIEKGRHALAIDENRVGFTPTLWTDNNPAYNRKTRRARLDASNLIDGISRYHDRIEQRWFVGAHTNVGGGYDNDPLQQITLNYIVTGAEKQGLHFRGYQPLSGIECLAGSPHPSLETFMYGLYQWIPVVGRRYWRPIGSVTDVERLNVHETIDASVFHRWQKVPSYRPANLAAWAKRMNIDLDQDPCVTRSARTGVAVMLYRNRMSLERGPEWRMCSEEQRKQLLEQMKNLIRFRRGQTLFGGFDGSPRPLEGGDPIEGDSDENESIDTKSEKDGNDEK